MASKSNLNLDSGQAKDGDKSLRCWCCTKRTACIVGIVALLLAGGAAVAVYFIFFQDDGASDMIAMCGDCHCIVGENMSCPEEVPETDFPGSLLEILESQVPVNPYNLECDPYCDDCDCETTPPQQDPLVSLEETVCGLHYETVTNGTSPLSCVGATYHLASYASQDEADSAGAFVTHVGACGVCSTTQDLVVYLRTPDLTTDGKRCSKQGIFAFDAAVDCYMDLGFTRPCARAWAYNGLNTARECLSTCLSNLNKPNNGPAPECELNECIACDEDNSGPLFKQFAGRTRRRSGILSAIARPCSDTTIINHEACPQTEPLPE